MIRIHIVYLLGGLLLTLTAADKALAVGTIPDKPQNASISFGAEISSGKYGTDTTTQTLYMPLIATWSPNERFDIGIEVPFIYQSNDNVTTNLYQTSQQSTSLAKGGPGGSSGATLLQQGAGGPGGSAGTEGSVSSDSSSAVSGLGDIILRLGVIAFFEGKKSPQVRPSLYIKFPTASTSDGLGTGEFDAGAGVELTKWLNDVHLFSEGQYNWQGKADGFGLNNYFSYSGGIGYQLSDTFEPMVIVKGATAPSDYSSELLEVQLRTIWSLSSSTSLDLFGSRGIADSSPEYGGGIAVIYFF